MRTTTSSAMGQRQQRPSRLLATIAVLLGGAIIETRAFVPSVRPTFWVSPSTILLHAAPAESTSSTAAAPSFIQTELRGAAMRLHTREQSPKEGQVESSPAPETRYVPTHADYLAFLVDSQHVYQAMEDIVNEREELCVFRNTGLERTHALELDIAFMVSEFGLERPKVGKPGRDYAEALRQMDSIPEFMCHYYNHYFAHTAGGRMIGKQMSSLLLGGKTLEFYKWDGDLNKIKNAVKDSIEAMAATWNDKEKEECVAATAAAFQGGGSINGYLSGRVVR